MPEQGVCRELVDLYFRYIHVTFHNLFHRPSFEVQVRGGSIHTYTLLFSADDTSIALARARLERSFGVVSRLQRFWPALRASSSRLAAFHAACLAGRRTSSTSTGNSSTRKEGGGDNGGGGGGGGGGGEGTFRLDWWMLRFLVDFAKPVDDGWERD
jgi:uncharacterized membrane protein YgcG